MKYVLTGGAGHITKPLAEKLLAGGHHVTVIGRNAENLKPLTEKGAKAAIGSVEDVNFLKLAFAGADAVYTMVPPNFNPKDWKEYIRQTGQNYAEAIKTNGIKHVVNLSSIGAHRADGCGPVSGLHCAEAELNKLDDTNILHLRPGFFYMNFFSLIPLIKGNGISGGNYGNEKNKMIFSGPIDIAEAATEELLHLNFKGHSVRYLSSDERTFGDVAKALGTATGNPQLPWIEFSDEQTLEALKGAGLTKEIAKNYTEMGAGIRNGIMQEDYYQQQVKPGGKIKLEDFAKTFGVVYNSQ
jgi:uncharacterized protein YbjT (DUF2867 family)